MKLLHSVSRFLLFTGKTVLFLSGFVFIGQPGEGLAEARHLQPHSNSGHHKKQSVKVARKHHGKHYSRKVLKHRNTSAKVKAVHVAGASAGDAGGVSAAKAMKPSAVSPQSLATQPEQEKGTETGFPIPRFASLRADRVYMRRGPGDRYPIDWVYHRRGLPVKIEREFDVWRLVEDSEGQKGWVHRVTLRGNRTFVVLGNNLPSVQNTKNSFSKHADPFVIGYISTQEISHQKGDYTYLLSSAGQDQRVVAILKAGVVGQLINCPQKSVWCHVKVADYEGWVQRKYIWGLLPEEIIDSK